MRAAILHHGPRVRRASLLCAVVAGPVIIAPRLLMDPINVPKMSLLYVCVGIAAAARLAEIAAGGPTEGLRRLLVPVLATILPLLIAWGLSEHRGWTLFGLYPRFLGLVPYLVTCLMGVLLADAFADDLRALAWALLLSGAVVGSYSLLQVLRVDPFVWSVETTEFGIVRASSTLGNPNFAGAFLAVVLPVGVAVALWDTGRRDVAWVLTALTAFGWVVSFSQGPWLAGGAGVALIAAVTLRGRNPGALRYGWLVATAAAALAVGAVGATILSGTAAARLGPTVESRGWFWTTAAAMVVEDPLTGWGPNAFAIEGVRFRPEDEALTSYWIAEDPHNLVLSHSVSAGLLGTAGSLTLIAWVLIGARRELRAAAGIRAGLAAGAVAYLIQGLVGVDEPGVRVAGWAVIAGLGLVALPGGMRRPRWAPVAAGMAPIVALGAVTFAFISVRADAEVRTGFLAALDNKPTETSQHFRAALDLVDSYDYRLIYGTKIGELATRRGAEGAEYYAEMRSVFSYLDGFPQITGLISEARLVLAWGEKVDPDAYPLALQLFESARRLDPHHPLLAVETSDALRALDREEEAVRLLESYLERDPPQPEFYGALALVNAELGDVSGARRWADIALEIDSADERALLALQELGSGT